VAWAAGPREPIDVTADSVASLQVRKGLVWRHESRLPMPRGRSNLPRPLARSLAPIGLNTVELDSSVSRPTKSGL